MRSNKLVFKQQIHSGAINAVKVNDFGQGNSKKKYLFLTYSSDYCKR